MSKSNAIQIVQGGLYGSEAKGSVAAHQVNHGNIDIAVRTGAVNAGHTCYLATHPAEVLVSDGEGGSVDVTPHGPVYEKFVMQQLPVGFVRKETQLIIGPGALVDPVILKREIDDIHARTGEDIRHRLIVDYRAYLHWPQFTHLSKESGRHELIGATGKGCSEAMISRLRLRGVENFTVGAHATKLGMDLPIGDTEEHLNNSYDEGASIQLEGTQGQLLDLCLGPYPYTTHKQTGPAQWMLEAGLSPALPTDIVMVIRTFPIRVAGNSGPLPNEISWPLLAKGVNEARDQYDLPPVVDMRAVAQFEDAVRRVAASGEFKLPLKSDGLDQHLWDAAERHEFRDTLSHLNARALAEMSEEARTEVGRLFEMTTVTRKLRRIAAPDAFTIQRAARQVRPTQVVITFMNYLFPEYWGSREPAHPAEQRFIEQVERWTGAPVTWFNRGPLPCDFIEA